MLERAATLASAMLQDVAKERQFRIHADQPQRGNADRVRVTRGVGGLLHRSEPRRLELSMRMDRK